MRIKPLSTLPLILAAGVFLAALPLAASTTSPGGRIWDNDDGAPPTEVTGSVNCLIKRVHDDRILTVLDDSGEHRLRLNEKVPIRPQSRKHFGGRRKIGFGDLEVGHWVKVTFLKENGRIVRVKVLKESSIEGGAQLSQSVREAEAARLASIGAVEVAEAGANN